jgi:hypothetical protein
MPEFRAEDKNNKEAAELLQQHKVIHTGLGITSDYLEKCQKKEVDFELSVLKEKMDTFGEVLWTHLDQEVKALGAENMRRYWTIDEMKGFLL